LSPTSGGKKKKPTLVDPLETAQLYNIYNGQAYFMGIHSFSSLSHDRSKASAKASSPHSVI
jgi:hypothetical protein